MHGEPEPGKRLRVYVGAKVSKIIEARAAMEKADALASAAGTEAGCVLSINENTWSYYSGSWGGGRDRNTWTQNVVQNVTGDQSMPDEMPISVGKIAIHAEVSASFSLQ